MRSGMMKGTLLRGLAERLEHERERLLQHEREGLVVDRRPSRRQLGRAPGPARRACAQRSSEAMQSAERTGCAVMELEAVAQREGVGELVVAERPGIDHLRLRLEVLVEREQRVVDHVAVVARDVGRGPDRIEAAQIRLRDELQGLLLRRCGLGEQRAAGNPRRQSQRCEHASCLC